MIHLVTHHGANVASGEERPLELPKDAHILREKLETIPEAKLLVIDTVPDVMGAKPLQFMLR